MKKFSFGGMRLPLLDANDGKSIDQQQTNQMIDKMIESGFTYFDTAYPYHGGMAEGAFKKALIDRYPRESFMIADKMPSFYIYETEEFDKIFNEQLERTGAGYFDYYLLHNLGAGTYKRMTDLGAYEYLWEKKKEGKIKKLGFSYHDKAELLDRILTEHPETDFVQLQINYADWESPIVQSRLNYEVCLKHNKPVIVMEPAKGGSLANVPAEVKEILRAYDPERSDIEWAMRFPASLEGVWTVLSGMSSMEQLEENLVFMNDFKPLSEEELEVLKKAAEKLASLITIPCTACNYCTGDCPMNINIPAYFNIYNSYKIHTHESMPVMHYLRQAHGRGRASECIGCKNCESHCPQHIDITGYLKKVVDEIEIMIDPKKSY